MVYLNAGLYGEDGKMVASWKELKSDNYIRVFNK